MFWVDVTLWFFFFKLCDFSFLIYWYIYWLLWVFVSVWAFSSWDEQRLQCVDFSLQWPLVTEHGLWVRWAQWLWHMGCSAANEIFLDQRSNWCPLHCKAVSKPQDHQGSPTLWCLKEVFYKGRSVCGHVCVQEEWWRTWHLVVWHLQRVFLNALGTELEGNWSLNTVLHPHLSVQLSFAVRQTYDHPERWILLLQLEDWPDGFKGDPVTSLGFIPLMLQRPHMTLSLFMLHVPCLHLWVPYLKHKETKFLLFRGDGIQ